MGGGGYRIQTPSDRGVIETVPPPIGGVIESGPIPYHLLETALVIINERPLAGHEDIPKTRPLLLLCRITFTNLPTLHTRQSE